MTNRVQIITEVGSNYDNDIELAKKYIRNAKNVGADKVKFQTLKKDKLIAPKVMMKNIWRPHPAWENFGNLELDEQWHFLLKSYAEEISIAFFSTPFYLEAVELLEKVGVEQYKIASGDITFTPLLKEVGQTGKPVLLSTGGSTNKDIENALTLLSRSGSGPVTLLHCVVCYPPKYDEINLRAMVTMKETFETPVGLSDHSPGDTIAIAAVALGASVVEKHVTFDRSLEGPDHPFAMTFEKFGLMVNKIRILEKSLGDGDKQPSFDEKNRQHLYRRGVYNPVTLEPIQGNEGIWLRPEHKKQFSKN